MIFAGQNGKIDRRVPFYILDGCDYMLEAYQRCDSVPYPSPAAACCPIGFECVGNGQEARCQEAPPTYALSPGCTAFAKSQGPCGESG